MEAINNTGSFRSEHEVVLQGLSQWLPYPDTSRVPGGKVFYNVNNFTGTEDRWTEVPIIFVPRGTKVSHPDHTAISQDPEGTARAMGYKIAGRLNNVKVTGSQVVADAILSDPQAAQLAKDGRLGLSTGFDAMIRPDGRIQGKVSANHLLVFLRCAHQPGEVHCGTGNDPRASFDNLARGQRSGSKDCSEMEEEQQADRDMRNKRPLEHAIKIPESFVEAARQREQNALETIRARGKFNAREGRFEDWRPGEGPE